MPPLQPIPNDSFYTERLSTQLPPRHALLRVADGGGAKFPAVLLRYRVEHASKTRDKGRTLISRMKTLMQDEFISVSLLRARCTCKRI